MSQTATTQDRITNDQLLELLNNWFYGDVDDVADGYRTYDEEKDVYWTFYMEEDGVEVSALTSTTTVTTAAELEELFFLALN